MTEDVSGEPTCKRVSSIMVVDVDVSSNPTGILIC